VIASRFKPKPPVNKYRLYVDEVGNPSLTAAANPNERYLSLTGVIFGLNYVRDVLHPEVERVKRTFLSSHPDEPVIFHRTEIRNKNRPFHALRDPAICTQFDRAIIGIITDAEYAAVTVVIDKQEHHERYRVWQYDPYHYCMEIVLERYVLWLEKHSATGDVMSESRGGKEDRRLKASFEHIVEKGNQWISKSKIDERLTSKQLKVVPKKNNVAGLQIADLVAHPCFAAAKARHGHDSLPQNFGGTIASIIESSKYIRSPGGKVEGWGRKWLP